MRSAPDDPIVKPGQPGASHNHEFYGNFSVTAFSTYGSMVAAPTECADHSGGDRGDTAGYWHPTLFVNGERRAASEADFYYDTQSAKQGPIAREFSLDIDDRIWAPAFSLTIQDDAVVEAEIDVRRPPIPDARIGGTLKGSFDFLMQRGQGAQTFP